MSLVGIRDMSVIETPPKDRLAIQTNVVRFDQPLIARVVRNELARGGQVYFVHNRVESIYSIGNLLTRLVPEAKVVVGHGQMARGRARARDGRLHGAQVRHPARHDHRRERPRHPERQHDRHQPRRPLRPLAALPAARARRAIRPARLRLPADPAGQHAVAGRAQAARRDPRVLRPGQRVPRGGARPRDPRRGQPARRRAERAHRGDRLRDVHEAARADRARAEGRGDRGRDARDGEPQHRPADRRGLRARAGAAARALPAGGGRAHRPGARRASSRRSRTATGRCRPRCSTWWITAASAWPPTASASNRSTARARSSSLRSRGRAGPSRSGCCGWSTSGRRSRWRRRRA